MTLLAAYVVCLGAIVGSFLNVCIVRWPKDESVVRPRSKCPHCQHGIAWYDNVPVVSWLLRRGRCRHCAAPIAWVNYDKQKYRKKKENIKKTIDEK